MGSDMLVPGFLVSLLGLNVRRALVGGAVVGLVQRNVASLGPVAHAQDLAVAQVPDRAVVGADAGDPQPHGLHTAHHFAGFNDVANSVLVFNGNEDPRQEVADQLLGAEGDGYTEDAHAGQQRGNVDVQVLQHIHAGNDHHQHAHHAVEQRT